jgi:hypothetical protein
MAYEAMFATIANVRASIIEEKYLKVAKEVEKLGTQNHVAMTEMLQTAEK